MDKKLNQWWFRLLKVIYVILFLTTIGFSLGVTLSDSKPHTNIYLSTYNFMCQDGSVHGKYDSVLLDKQYYLDVEYFDFYDVTYKRLARFQCQYNEYLKTLDEEDKKEWYTLAINNEIEDLSITKNYTIGFEEKIITGTWQEYYLLILLSLIVPIIVFSLIRYIFFYVAKNEHKFIFNEFKNIK